MNILHMLKKLLAAKKDRPARSVHEKESAHPYNSARQGAKSRVPEPEHSVHREEPIHRWQTQFNNRPENAKPIQVTIGLDFGTAFTKVVISGAGEKYGVPLNDGKTGSGKYFLPTCWYENSPDENGVQTPITDLKMRILENNLDAETKKHIISYLASVLQKSRHWLMTEKQAVFRNNYLKWEVNIGLPTEKHSDESLHKIYRELVGTAWYESTNPNSEGENNDVQNHNERELHRDLIAGFPEFSAQIQGYISSPQRRPGIHALVDVGAGTVDATVFIVHRDEETRENRHPVLTSSVEKLGTTYLAEHRCTNAGEVNSWRPSPQDFLPSFEEFSRDLGITKEKLHEIDDGFKRKLQTQINSRLNEAYNDTPNQGNWEDGIPLILCGGGARVEFYNDYYSSKVIESLRNTLHGRSLHNYSLPENGDLDAPDLLPEDGDRLFVAYGLSFDESEIGKIINPLPPIGPNAENAGQGNETCPYCNGTGGLHQVCTRCGGSGFIRS